jgi:hypothetical protein
LLANVKSMQQVASPVYGERNVTQRYRVCDLLWRPAGRLVRFVVVVHPTRGSCILMCTDTSAERRRRRPSLWPALQDRAQLQTSHAPARFIRLPFLDERHGPVALPQRQSIPKPQIGRLPKPCERKMRAYHAFIRAGVVAQGLLQFLAVIAPKLVLGLLRVLAANHSSWHSAIRICRSKRATTITSGISPAARKKQFSGEIHRRSTGHAKYADLSLGFMTKKRDS